MPELSRFFGIVIRMYVEAGSHHTPHFHAYYQQHVAAFSFDSVDLMVGELPVRQRRLVEAWAEIHRDELVANWTQLQSGGVRRSIDPLG